MKLKKRHIAIAVAACLLLFMVKMCESDDFTVVNKKDKEEIEQLGVLQHESDSLLKEVIHEIDTRQHQYGGILDSLNNIILNDNLTVEEVKRLEKKIEDTELLLELAKNVKDTIIMTADPIERDSVVYNIIKEDSVEYNIIQKDSVVYNITYLDSIVKRTVYEIDTIHYDSDEIKKLKIKGN